MIKDHEWLDLAVKNAQRNIADCIANSVHLKPRVVEKSKFRSREVIITEWDKFSGFPTAGSGGCGGVSYPYVCSGTGGLPVSKEYMQKIMNGGVFDPHTGRYL